MDSVINNFVKSALTHSDTSNFQRNITVYAHVFGEHVCMHNIMYENAARGP